MKEHFNHSHPTQDLDQERGEGIVFGKWDST